MTDVLCKACGTKLGEPDDYEAGDSEECEECGTGYDFVENDNPAYDTPLMVTDQDTVPARDLPEVAEIEGASPNEDGDMVVTWVRSDGVRVKEYAEDFHGDLPEGMDTAQGGSAATEPEVSNE